MGRTLNWDFEIRLPAGREFGALGKKRMLIHDGDVGSETTCQFMKGQQLELELERRSIQRITSEAAESRH
jgi:hypothetical protein